MNTLQNDVRLAVEYAIKPRGSKLRQMSTRALIGMLAAENRPFESHIVFVLATRDLTPDEVADAMTALGWVRWPRFGVGDEPWVQ